MPAESSERELKIDVPFHFALPDLSPAGVRLEPRPAVQLAATYWDTADLHLLRRGITLRYRRGGSHGTKEEDGWTLKLPKRTGGGNGPRLDRTELTWTAPADRVPAEALALVSGVSFGRPLEPVADMVTSRRRWHLLCSNGPVAELDDDDVVVTTGAQRQSFRQIEVELTGDDERVLQIVAEELQRAGAPPGEAEPKVQRAFADRLIEHTTRPPLGPRSSLPDAVSAAIRAGLDRLVAHDPGVRLHDEEPEFVHQARVATRRLRSDLRTLGADLDPAWLTATRDELRWMGGLLGDIRDADVLGERFEARRARLSGVEQAMLDELLARVTSQRLAAYDRVDEAMASERYHALLERLAAPPPFRMTEPAAAALGPRIRGAWRKLRREVRAAGPQPSDTDLHQIRIRAKQLRYAAEASAPVLGRSVGRLAEAAADLQTVLGDHHDAVVAEEWIRQATVRVRGKGRLLVAGELIGFERVDAAAAKAKWPRAWKAVRRAHKNL
ncbi:MAG: CYTH and CHAD domain-containing protein [Acidimicrobiaceae bacterium]|nr:CYTH and CHAD domain-containing protein [Acidimicrobiaceae bacterium]